MIEIACTDTTYEEQGDDSCRCARLILEVGIDYNLRPEDFEESQFVNLSSNRGFGVYPIDWYDVLVAHPEFAQNTDVLGHVATAGKLDRVQHLINMNADVTAQDECYGRTALDNAESNSDIPENQEVIKFLLSIGAPHGSGEQRRSSSPSPNCSEDDASDEDDAAAYSGPNGWAEVSHDEMKAPSVATLEAVFECYGQGAQRAALLLHLAIRVFRFLNERGYATKRESIESNNKMWEEKGEPDMVKELESYEDFCAGQAASMGSPEDAAKSPFFAEISTSSSAEFCDSAAMILGRVLTPRS